MHVVDYHLKDENEIQILHCGIHQLIIYYNLQLTKTYRFQSDQTVSLG